MTRYHIVTLGCPKNTTDSSRIARRLEAGGAVESGRGDADLVILNTCGFIDDAKAESDAAARLLAEEKRDGQRLVVTGCWSELEPDDAGGIVGVDDVLGIEAWDAIARRAARMAGVEAERDIPAGGMGQPAQPSAYLKISDGCARPCTFCNIPGIKGRLFRSGGMDELVAEARELVGRGAKELVLVAQDSTSYAVERGERDGLARLLERLAAESGARWLRLMYAYPGAVTPALIEVMASAPQVCHYLDIPLQHGAESVLRRMKRPHNARMVARTLERLRAAMPDIALRTTFLVGFPGETEAEFGQLLEFVRETRFDRAGAFTFSPQEGTPAAEMPDQVPEPVKRERYERLMAELAAISAEINEAQVGRELELLVESEPGQTDEDGDPILAGRSYREAPEVDGLIFANGTAEPGQLIPVRIESALGHDLWAVPLSPTLV